MIKIKISAFSIQVILLEGSCCYQTSIGQDNNVLSSYQKSKDLWYYTYIE